MGMDWSWDKSTPVTEYRKFGCPKCGAKHKYGHLRDYVTCHRCWYEFSPEHDARRYEDERLVNLSQAELDAALIAINGTKESVTETLPETRTVEHTSVWKDLAAAIKQIFSKK